jgi:hypothetical protein
MIKIRIKTPTGKVTLAGFGPQKYQMYNWGKFAVETVKTRVAAGLGSDDQPMKGLTKGYAIRKTKAGAGNRRNLKLTGGMIDNLQVRYADPNKVRADITSRLGRIKARTNERRTPWFGFSRADEKRIFTEGTRIFGPNLRNIGLKLRADGALSRRPIWLDPLGIQSRSRLAA